jgi:DNA topoisomerase-1
VQREREIEGFNPVASFRVDAQFTTKEGNKFKAKLPKNFDTEAKARAFLTKNKDAVYSVSDL